MKTNPVYILPITSRLLLVTVHLSYTDKFWPGPLTIIGLAKAIVPPTVSANTGWVGVRVPNHALALSLLRECDVPVAAPSANRFGHVSPTTAAHVMTDLGESNIYILDTERGDATTCSVGIESTVCKIDGDNKELVLFRRGGVSQEALQEVLTANNISEYSIRVIKKQASHSPDAEGQEAPGQMLTHYAPDIDSYLVSWDPSSPGSVDASCGLDLSEAVVIDFHASLAHLQESAKGYKDLSPSGSIPEAAANLFSTLRWSEEVLGARYVLLPNVEKVEHELTLAVFDRLFRAASGREVNVFVDAKGCIKVVKK
jgi:L-threonylcarbamoyladenylate synthase